MDDALGVLAADVVGIAADVIGSSQASAAGNSLCASPTCRAAFFDSGQSHARRWCDMNTCGNRQKKARFNASRRRTGSVRGDLRAGSAGE
ncbi:CGNR zinc finger domain-containing protein [Kribbella sp. NPDC051770]|uniref:CGNR zinc finger domain-containing protein n=1 Tax=Kribbella sp. NPDC051770 TaxID=3155413 RepID=UPI0034383F64